MPKLQCFKCQRLIAKGEPWAETPSAEYEGAIFPVTYCKQCFERTHKLKEARHYGLGESQAGNRNKV